MRYGAVIVAAGMSSRMGDFKPMMPFGTTTIIRFIIFTLKKSGIENIVLITGNQAEKLENHVKDLKVTCIRNVDYAETQMFDSAKLGLKHLFECCDKILFTPADVPMFSEITVKTLLSSDLPLVRPAYHGKKGHPLLLSKKIIPFIFSYNGPNGLIGALHNCHEDICSIEMDDEGAVFDVDTKEDYCTLVQMFEEKTRDETLYSDKNGDADIVGLINQII